MSRSSIQTVFFFVSFFAGLICFVWTGPASGQESNGELPPPMPVPRAAKVQYSNLDSSLEIYRKLEDSSSADKAGLGQQRAGFGAPGSETDPLFANPEGQNSDLEMLELALERGDARSLQLLREELLENKPGYREEILPALESMVLAELLFRFKDRDWKDWAELGVDSDGDSTEARAFVETISSVNTELGVFSDTAGHLLHRLYRRTESGSSFNLKLELQDLIDNAETLVGVRANSFVPAAYLFSPAIISNKSFTSALESKRCQFFGRFVEDRPNWVEKQLGLLRDLDLSRCGSVVEVQVAGILHKVSKNGSRLLRETMFKDQEMIESLRTYSGSSKLIEKRLASLYSAKAIDFLESGQLDAAGQNLKAAEKLYPGHSLYSEIRGFIKQSLAEPDESSEKAMVADRDGGAESATVSSLESKDLERSVAQPEPQVSDEDSGYVAEDNYVEDEVSEVYEEEDSEEEETSGESGWVLTAMIWVIVTTFLAGILLFFVKKLAEARLTSPGDVKEPAGFEDEDFWDHDEPDPEGSEFEADLDEVNNF